MAEIQSTWYRVAVKAIIRNDEGKVMLCKEVDGNRDLPGGGIDRGEDDLTCLRREIQEETGLTVTSVDPRPLAFVTVRKPSSKDRPWLGNVCYEVKVADLNFLPSDECTEIGFFDLEGIQEIQKIENVEPVFRKIYVGV